MEFFGKSTLLLWAIVDVRAKRGGGILRSFWFGDMVYLSVHEEFGSLARTYIYAVPCNSYVAVCMHEDWGYFEKHIGCSVMDIHYKRDISFEKRYTTNWKKTCLKWVTWEIKSKRRTFNKVSMIRKYHNHTHCTARKSNTTSTRHIKTNWPKQPALPSPSRWFQTRMDTK